MSYPIVIDKDLLDYCVTGDITKANKVYGDMKISNTLRNQMIIRAFKYKHFDLLRYLFEQEISNCRRGKNLSNFIYDKAVDVAKWIIKSDIDVPYYETLKHAAERGYLEIVECIMQKQRPLPKKTSYDWYNNWKDEFMIDDYEKILIIACENNRIDIVQYLVENWIDMNDIGHSKKPLIIAYHKKDYEMMDCLIKNGADVNIILDNRDAYVLLTHAANKGDAKMVQYLIDNGADVNFRYDKDSALICAAKFGYLDVVKLLVENGADVNKINKHQLNAVIKAAQNNHLDVVKYLVENCGDIYTTYFSALDFARRKDHKKTTEYLEEIIKMRTLILLSSIEKTVKSPLLDRNIYHIIARMMI
jgi:hypothetical protein